MTATVPCIDMLILRAAAGDHAAFAALYRATAGMLHLLLTRMLEDGDAAEDALQEVFTRVWLRAGSFDPARGNGRNWLIAIARHHAIDRHRQLLRPLHDEIDMALIHDRRRTAEQRLALHGTARCILACMNRLDAPQAAALKAAYLHGESYGTLALRHEVPLNTMRSWLRRSIIKVRRCLDEEPALQDRRAGSARRCRPDPP